MSARRWIGYLLPDALSMQPGWLRYFVRGSEDLLSQVTRSPLARRLLTRQAHEHYRIAVPPRASLAPNQRWLLGEQPQQQALARRLGLEALHGFIRTAVDAVAVTALRKELGDDGYRAALAGPGLAVEGLDRAAFSAALRDGRLEEHAVSVGAAVLETTTRAGDPFAQLRMRFAFSPACWRMRPKALQIDEAELAARIEAAT
jgi:hypothetical protein